MGDSGRPLSGSEPPALHPGRLDVGVEHVSDCERLAKQCQLWDLLSDLEAKCEKVSEFGASRLRVRGIGRELAGSVGSLQLCSPLHSGVQARHMREGADHRAPPSRPPASGGHGPAGRLCPAP